MGVVDGDDRIAQHALPGHAVQADDAGGGFLSAAAQVRQRILALGVGHCHQVAAVVHGEVGFGVERGVDVGVVAVAVLAPDGIDHNPVVVHQRSSVVILGAERVGGTQHHFGAAIAQRGHQIGSLGGDVQAGGDARALERLFFQKALPDEVEHRHLLRGPLDANLAALSQSCVLNIRTDLGCGSHEYSFLGRKVLSQSRQNPLPFPDRGNQASNA